MILPTEHIENTLRNFWARDEEKRKRKYLRLLTPVVQQWFQANILFFRRSVCVAFSSVHCRSYGVAGIFIYNTHFLYRHWFLSRWFAVTLFFAYVWWFYGCVCLHMCANHFHTERWINFSFRLSHLFASIKSDYSFDFNPIEFDLMNFLCRFLSCRSFHL